jgi:hypothetical protein
MTYPLATGLAQTAGSGNGFLLGRPMGSFIVRGGWALASAGSDLFSFTTKELTLDRGDFSSPTLDVDLAFHVASRTDLVLSAAAAGVNKRSEFRAFVDNNKQPIEQQTQFRRVPLTIGIRQYLAAPGRSIGKLAWIPARTAAYVGLGGGTMWYQFRQDGDFIDFVTNDVFPSTVKSDGWTTTAHALAGADYTISPRCALNGEARYTWSKADLSSDFTGFHRLDLSGLSTTVGLSVRF